MPADSDWEPGPKTRELMGVLHVLIDLLRRAGETQWLEKLIEGARRIRNSDYSGITYLLALSHRDGFEDFNDERVDQAGRTLNPPVYLEGYRDRMFILAREIKEETHPRRYLKKKRPWRE